MAEKNKKYAGADERTPSRAEYFSWINNTNEGSTEKQTLINLDYFAFLKRTYNMQLDIYAWDAGNLDGAEKTYETFDSPKIKAQYPNGFGPVVAAARDIGIRMGLWGGADGFGDTEESANARIEQMVSLARDYNFALFKFDAVCGQLPPEHDNYFIEMMTKCREYSPDLILLNHRLELSDDAEKHATTFLWEGQETYVDIHIANKITAPHHRAFLLDRGQTPGLRRLTEDHGVCLSSFLDFFEDDMIIQAFGRNLILAPEIYGNPWFLRDDEQAHLARIFNLHRRYRDILIDGMPLPEGEFCPKETVVRGDSKKRFVICANMDWYEKQLKCRLDSSIGLDKCERVSVIIHHPYEKFVGEFEYGSDIALPLEPFRAALIEICDSKISDVMLSGCEYEVLHEDVNGKVDTVKILSSEGRITYTDGTPFKDIPAFDNTLPAPTLLAEGECFVDVPENWEQQMEAALFAQDHDSFEKRCMLRSGETAIPEVKAARDAFFAQEMYAKTGCECAFAFDGKENTFFDNYSKIAFWNFGFRHDGGCLRVDFGAEYEADTVLLEYFDTIEPEEGYLCTLTNQTLTPICHYSTDLGTWTETRIDEVRKLRREKQPIIVQHINNLKEKDGYRKTVTYPVNGPIRYFRMPCPIDHIFKIALLRDGKELTLTAPRANNILPYGRKVCYTKELNINVPDSMWSDGVYLSVCLEGTHGAEGAFAVLDIDGKYYTAPDRAPGYSANPWECYAYWSHCQDHHYTYYIPVARDMCNKDMTVRVLGTEADKKDYNVRVFLCHKNSCPDGVVCNI